MQRHARMVRASFLAATAASVAGLVMGAQPLEAQQELVSVKSSRHVLSAVWTRHPDGYTLQVVIDRSMPSMPVTAVDTSEARIPVPQNTGPTPQPIPNWQADAPSKQERASIFIANTIANLRGLDASFCGRTLTSSDGRRNVPGQRVQAPATAPLPPGFRDRRVEVWLLGAGGAQIQNATYNCDDPGRNSSDRTDFLISYGYSVADGAQAIAAAIRIGDDFYIEKLQPLAEPARP